MCYAATQLSIVHIEACSSSSPAASHNTFLARPVSASRYALVEPLLFLEFRDLPYYVIASHSHSQGNLRPKGVKRMHALCGISKLPINKGVEGSLRSSE